MTGPEVASARLVARWARVYTTGLPAGARNRRRAEIAADIHGQLEDARTRRERPTVTAAMMLSRRCGRRQDLSWRREVSGPARLARWQARRGWWIAGAVLITLAAGAAWLGYGVSLRSGGDQQPLRLATRAASQLEAGSPPASILPPAITMATSPAPFVMVFDRRHHVRASSGRLNGRIPVLPGGVLAWAAHHGEDRITWEPQPGLREAAIIEPYGQPRLGYVLAAHSLQTTSARQRTLTWSIGCCWLAALTVSFQITRLLPPHQAAPQPGPRTRLPATPEPRATGCRVTGQTTVPCPRRPTANPSHRHRRPAACHARMARQETKADDHGGVPPGHGAPNPKRHVHAGRSRELAMIMGVPEVGM